MILRVYISSCRPNDLLGLPDKDYAKLRYDFASTLWHGCYQAPRMPQQIITLHMICIGNVERQIVNRVLISRWSIDSNRTVEQWGKHHGFLVYYAPADNGQVLLQPLKTVDNTELV